MLSLYRTFLLKWTARTGSVVCLGVVAALYLGEGFDPARVAPIEWLGLVFFPGGVVLGMILAWRWEGPGSLIAIGSLAAFYLIYGWGLSGELVQGAAFLIFTTPAFLYLADWVLSRPPRLKSMQSLKPR